MPLPLPEPFDYAVPEGLELAPGDHVVVPLGPRRMRGLVAGVRDIPGLNRPLKPVLERIDEPALPPGTLKFVTWAARWTCSPPGEVAALALRGLRAPPPKPEKRLVPTGVQPARAT
ncbi:primosomal protein N', partial [Caulobacter sp. 17J65-9]|nr:primosomal protein N' [Caulobacter sp. 17J65-9]